MARDDPCIENTIAQVAWIIPVAPAHAPGGSLQQLGWLTLSCRGRLGVAKVAIPIEAEQRAPLVLTALDRVAVGQDQLFQLTAIVELQPWTSSDWDAIERPILRKCRTDELSFVIERDPCLPWKRSADEDVFTREGGD